MVREDARIAVCIADGDRGRFHVRLRDVGAAVADGLAFVERLDVRDVGDKGHDVAQVEAVCHDVRRLRAVEDNPGARQIVMALRQVDDAGAVRGGNDEAVFLRHVGNRFLETGELG